MGAAFNIGVAEFRSGVELWCCGADLMWLNFSRLGIRRGSFCTILVSWLPGLKTICCAKRIIKLIPRLTFIEIATWVSYLTVL